MFIRSTLKTSIAFGCLYIGLTASAEQLFHISTEKNEVTPQLSTPQPEIKNNLAALPQALPSDQTESEKVTFTPKYLKEHPEELETLLKQLLATGNEHGLKLLLPIYQQVPNADPSVFDWGNAIIAMRENKYAEAVNLYRKLNSQIPDSKTLRFQMALALLANGELIAAKDQFEKLKSSDASDSDNAILDNYISMINSRDAWDIGGGITYAYNDNINNAPPKGTQLILANGATVTSNTDPKKARGISYNFYADKTWSIDLAKFASLHINLDGTQYFDQKSYSDLTARIGAGGGIRTGRAKFELIPYIQKRLYGLGQNGDGKLKNYAFSYGLRAEGQYWITPTIRYQAVADFGRDNYVNKYNYLNGNTFLLSNTLLFATSQKQFFYGGIDFITKTASDTSDAYNRYGFRLGWQREWGKGISTSLSGGYSQRINKGEDFFGMRRRDKDYRIGLSIWNRQWHYHGITPRISFNYNKTKSNNPLYNYDNSRIFIDFSKTF